MNDPVTFATRRRLGRAVALGLALLATGCTYTRGQMPGARRGPAVPQRVGTTSGRPSPKPMPLADSASPTWPPGKGRRPTKPLRRCTAAEQARLPRSVTTGVEDPRWIGTDRYTTAVLTLVLLLQMGCGVAVPSNVPQAPPT